MPDLDQIKQGEQGVRDRRGRSPLPVGIASSARGAPDKKQDGWDTGRRLPHRCLGRLHPHRRQITCRRWAAENE